MRARLDPFKTAPVAMKAAMAVEGYVQKCGLERSLIDLVNLRASQLNGCSYGFTSHGRLGRELRRRSARARALRPRHETRRFPFENRTAFRRARARAGE
jgi:AhpD family alkylhydroperoxidase